MKQNPFKYGQVVTGNDFCGRSALVKKLHSLAGRGQNAVIQGERRVGKTSLIYHTISQVMRKRLLYVDLLGIKTGEDIIRRMIQGIELIEQQDSLVKKIVRFIPHITVSVSLDPVTGMPSLSPSIAQNTYRPESLVGILDLVAHLHKQKSLVVAFDEFQDVLKLRDAWEILAHMRSRIQFQGNICFLYAGSIRNDMWTIFHNPDSPFFKSAMMLEVDASDFDNFDAFMARQFKRGRRRLGDGLFSRITETCFHNPGDIQQCCAALWDVTQEDCLLSESHYSEALMLIFRNELRGYETWLNDLSAQQSMVIKTLARLGGVSPLSRDFVQASGIAHTSSIKAALTRLVDKRLLFVFKKEYRFVNPFFRLWLVHKRY